MKCPWVINQKDARKSWKYRSPWLALGEIEHWRWRQEAHLQSWGFRLFCLSWGFILFKLHILLWVLDTIVNLILRWGNWDSEKLSNLSKLTEQGRGLVDGLELGLIYAAPLYEFRGCFRWTLPRLGILSSHHPGSFPSLKSKILHALRSQIPSLLLCTNTYLNSESSVRTSGCVLGDIC